MKPSSGGRPKCVQRTCLNPVSCFHESLEVSSGSLQTTVNVLISGYKPLQVPDPTILSLSGWNSLHSLFEEDRLWSLNPGSYGRDPGEEEVAAGSGKHIGTRVLLKRQEIFSLICSLTFESEIAVIAVQLMVSDSDFCSWGRASEVAPTGDTLKTR